MQFAPALEEMARVAAALGIRGRACDSGPSLHTWGGPASLHHAQLCGMHRCKQERAEWNQE